MKKRSMKMMAALLSVVLLCCGCSVIENVMNKINPPTLEEYLLDPEIKDQIDREIAKELEDEEDALGMVEVGAEGNTVVYTCTLNEPLIFADEVQKTAWINERIENSIKQEGDYEELVKDLEKYLKTDNITVRLDYVNPDGSLIMSYDYANPVQSTWYDSVEACLAVPGVAQRFVDEFELEGSGLSGFAYGDGNTLVYEMTMDEQMEGSEEELTEIMVEYMQENQVAFTTDFIELIYVVDADDLAIRYIFFNADGTEMYRDEFTMEDFDISKLA